MSHREAEDDAAQAAVAERPSRPPGFDMTYRPEECVFGPRWVSRIPSLVFLAAALIVGGIVLIGENSDPTSYLFRHVVTEDINRGMSMRTFAVVLAVGAISSLLSSGMRGVRVYSEGVETREVSNLFWPKVRRYSWPQMECIVLDMKSRVALDLWDGSRAFLPAVANHDKLSSTLERVAMARAIPVRGGSGLDDIPDPIERESLPPDLG
jgi:hypothetical protein